MIDRNLLKRISEDGDLEIGRQIKFNHEGCTAGMDTKQRLYIKRVDGGVLGYCHHCQQGGFYREVNTAGATLRKWLMAGAKEGDHEVVTYLPILRDINYPPILHWLATHYIYPLKNVDDCKHFQQLNNALVMPLCHDGVAYINNHWYGIQLRNFGKAGPKYLTKTKTSTTYGAWFSEGFERASNTLVITEDYTSAYRIFRDTPHTALALLTTTANASTLAKIKAYHFDFIFVWLDNDEAGLRGASKLVTRLQYILPPSTVVVSIGQHHNEPKTYSPIALKDMFKETGTIHHAL